MLVILKSILLDVIIAERKGGGLCPWLPPFFLVQAVLYLNIHRGGLQAAKCSLQMLTGLI